MTMLRRTLLPWGATLLLLTLCLMPKWAMPRAEEESSFRKIPHLDKVIHFSMFAGAFVLWARAGRSPVPTRSRVVTVLAVMFALAVGTELLQGLPQIERDPNTFDALADAAGAVAGVVTVVARGARRAGGETELC